MEQVTTELLFERLETRGHGAYGLARVSQLEHALQSAHLAQTKGLGDEMTIAALFHDVGHLVYDRDTDLAGQGIDDKHEDASAVALELLFGKNVSEPVRLHVDAKRYLCGAEADYFGKLSPDSVRSLELQGGPMKGDELAAFEAHGHFKRAIELRRIDDAAKVPGLEVPDLDTYRPMAKALTLG